MHRKQKCKKKKKRLSFHREQIRHDSLGPPQSKEWNDEIDELKQKMIVNTYSKYYVKNNFSSLIFTALSWEIEIYRVK